MTSYTKLNKVHESGKKLLNTRDLSAILEIPQGRTLENILKKLIESNVLTQIEKGKYFTTNNPPLDFEMANFIYTPSYISLETALNYFGVLSQFPHEVTSITTKRTKQKDINSKFFSYSRIKKEVFTGYQMIDGILIASPSKAFFDYLYFVSKALRTENYISEMDLSKIDKAEVKKYLDLLENDKVTKLEVLINKYL